MKATRDSAGLTLRDTAKIAGVSFPYLSNVENGLVTPTPSWVFNLMEAIGRHIVDTERAAS